MEILTAARVLSCKGAFGDFQVKIEKSGAELSRSVSSVVIAQGDRRQSNASFYGLQDCARTMTLSELKNALDDHSEEEDNLSTAKTVVFINGLRNESPTVVAAEAMKLAMRLTAERGVRTYILTKNLKVAADPLEALYRESRKAGTVYAKFEDTFPQFQPMGDTAIRVSFKDEITGKYFRLTADLVVVDETVVASPSAGDLAAIFKLESDGSGFLQADNVHRLSVLTNRKGILALNGSRCIQFAGEQLKDAANAALVLRDLPVTRDAPPQDRAVIDTGACVRCLTCVRLCSYGAINLDIRPVVAPEACERCGICAAECPCQAIGIANLGRADIVSRIAEADIPSGSDSFVPFIVAFACTRSAAPAGQLAACMGAASPAGLKIVDVPCAGSISLDHMLAAYENGADGVLILTCHKDNCHSDQGCVLAANRVERLKEMCTSIGIAPDRFALQPLASNMGKEFGEIVAGFEEKITELGPNKLKPSEKFLCHNNQNS